MTKNNKETKEWFKNWANEYDQTLGKVKRHHELLELMVELSKVKENDIVLDIGCGTGLLSLKFLKSTNCLITGIDNSRQMLKIFKNKIQELSLDKQVALKYEDAASLNFKKNSFEIVASAVTLHHVKNKLPVIRKIHNILKPGGRFVIGDLDMDTKGNLTNPERLIRIIDSLKGELALAISEGGLDAFNRMYDNSKRHILNEGEYCVSFRQWKEYCERAGFQKIKIKSLPGYNWFNVLVAIK